MTPPDKIAAPPAPGVLLILNDVCAGADEEFNHWYQRQHLADQLGIPGFKTARRYQALGGQPAYMTVYECQSVAVLSSPEYRQHLSNPSELANKLRPEFRNVLQWAGRETWSEGDGLGGTAIVVRCKPIQGKEADARRFIKEALGPRLAYSSVRITLWETDASVNCGAMAEAATRSAEDHDTHWILFLESYNLAKMALAVHAQILTCESAETGLLIGSWARYQLICARLSAAA
jgi:hypothetical protein